MKQKKLCGRTPTILSWNTQVRVYQEIIVSFSTSKEIITDLLSGSIFSTKWYGYGLSVHIANTTELTH